MTGFVRHRDRHVKGSVARVLEEFFVESGWASARGVLGQGPVS